MKRLRAIFLHSAGGPTLRSDDGVIEFTLAPTLDGVYVERVQLRAGSGRVAQSVLFTDQTSFKRWCDADAVRFDYPMVHVNLKRSAGELFEQPG